MLVLKKAKTTLENLWMTLAKGMVHKWYFGKILLVTFYLFD